MTERFLKENILWFLIVIGVFVAGIYFSVTNITNAINQQSAAVEKKQLVEAKKSQLTMLQKQRQAKEQGKKKTSQSGKVIYEVLGEQFSSEASFGIMFENILSNLANAGVRVRSIEYDYAPQEDKILQTSIQGYNACELSFVTVGKYAQLQNFFKNITKEKYLSSIQEVYIEPYDKDKTILIAKFKVRLYTKTI